MIALILGTKEGRDILSLLNKFTEDLFISTATKYGGELLKDYNFKIMNDKPLSKYEMINVFKKNKIKALIDASHPYALEVTKTCMEVSKELDIEYIRYERPSVLKEFKGEDKVITLESYEDLKDAISKIKGNILNTSGSRNIEKILNLNLENRIIHRILPSVKVLQKCLDLKIKVEDIIAIKGPITKELNDAFIKDYDGKALILKDSGKEGGTKEKILACLENNIYALVIKRKKVYYENQFNDVENLVSYIKSN